MHTIITLLITCILASCSPMQPPDGHTAATLIGPHDERIQLWVEIADDPHEHQAGLMHRTELGDDRGMLFVFNEPRILSFWMKNTLIPLDILYFDEKHALVSTQTMVPCEVDPCTTYPSNQPALYALEVNAGFVNEHAITEGWQLQLNQ